jgi:polysaccharide chain length determinant protein (PEP-CTERM system associated)
VQSGSHQNQVVRDFLVMIEAQIRGMWRYRWRALLVAWLLCAVGSLGVIMLPPVYGASARIYVDTENAIVPLLRGIAPSYSVLNEVTVVTREMLSRPNLAEVARATDLDLRTGTEEEFEDLLAELADRISVSGSEENIYSIQFEDRNRQKAVAVVDALVNTFVEQSLGASRTESSQAQTFLQSQITEYEQRLTAAEDRLARFKQENVEFMPGQRGDYFDRLQTAESTLEGTRSRLSLAQERRAELVRQLEGEEPVFGIMPADVSGSSGGGSTSAKIRELEAQVEELRLKYTDKHPRIGQILDTIELLKEKEAEEQQFAAANGTSPYSSAPLATNPVFQNMRIQLTDTEVEIASLRAELGQQQAEVQRLRTLVDTVPQVEAELSRLNRDYNVVKAKYEQLLEQLESANIGEEVEASIDEVQFRIIDPPFAALTPSGPNRALMMSAVLLLSLGVGGALTFLLNQIHPVFFTGRSVTSITGLPVLGAVSLFLSDEEKHQKSREHRQFAIGVLSLIAVFVLVTLTADAASPMLRNLLGTQT